MSIAIQTRKNPSRTAGTFSEFQSFSPEEIHDLRRWGGGSMGLHSIQPGMLHFRHPGVPGFIGYIDYGPCRFSIGHPVCPEGDMAKLLGLFHRSHPSIMFFHIDDKTADHLARLGYYVNQIGEESWVSLQEHTWKGKGFQDLRRSHNNAVRSGVTVKEQREKEGPSDEVESLCADWLAVVKAGKGELRIAARRPVFLQDFPARTFCGYLNGRLETFVQFDPVYKAGRAWGYMPAVSRRRPGGPKGAQAYVVKIAMEKFKSEGVERLFLGLMPACNVEAQSGAGRASSPYVTSLFRWFGRSGFAQKIYPFQSVSFHKSRYCGERQKVYLASNSRLPLGRLYCFSRLSGLL